MNRHIFILLLVVALASPLLGSESGESPIVVSDSTTTARIPSPIPDGAPSPPPPPVVKPRLDVSHTQVKRLHVVESPPMEGLPPVEGTITLTVHTAGDPGLPDPPVPPEPRKIDDPEILARFAEAAAKHRKTRHAFVSATVYDRSRTRLTCYPSGGLAKSVTAWSNLDFNHFSGFGSFEASDGDGEVRDYSLFMGIGNANLELRRKALAARGIEWEEPVIPELPDGAPAFWIETENPDPETVTLIGDLHALYRCEGARMAEACAAREAARLERKAYLLANPPVPKDVTVHFWKREAPSAEGGQP